MLSGLPFNDATFGSLPPHFKQEANELLTEDFWSDMIPNYDSYPEGLKRAAPHLLASLIYHEQYLRDTLSEHHPIFSSRVFSQNPQLSTLRSVVVTGIGRCPDTGS